MLKISTEIASAAAHVGDKKAIEMIAKAGFDAWDFSMFDMCPWDWENHCILPSNHPTATKNYLAYARKLRRIGEDCGIVCNQSHAPFPSAPMFDYLLRAIECTAEAGGEICIIHPVNDHTPEQNAEMYERLLPFAKSVGVKIATENMWNWDSVRQQPSPAACSDPASFLAHLHAVNDPSFVACLDLGHAEMRTLGTSAPEMIRALGSHLQALHIHDNDRFNDSHQIPFSMSMDFDAIARALAEMNSAGYLTLEADCYLKKFHADNLAHGLSDLAASAQRLNRMIDEARRRKYP